MFLLKAIHKTEVDYAKRLLDVYLKTGNTAIDFHHAELSERDRDYYQRVSERSGVDLVKTLLGFEFNLQPHLLEEYIARDGFTKEEYLAIRTNLLKFTITTLLSIIGILIVIK